MSLIAASGQGGLKNKTLFITGASRGIGRAIALRAARDGANIVIVAKTTEAHPKLPGTIYSVAEEVESVGGKALPIYCDIRFEDQIIDAVKKTVEKFGGIDILVNNASAISLTPTLATSASKFDLMHQINTRGTFLVSKHCIPYLAKSKNPHILNLSPPLSMKEHWFSAHVAYTIAKYGMSLCVLGMAGELRQQGIAVNALWPKTIIATAALQAIDSSAHDSMASKGRTPEIMADAAHVILTQPSRLYSGHFTVDEDILRSQGVSDFSKYAAVPGNKEFLPDFFLDEGYTFELPPAPGSEIDKSAVIQFKSSEEARNNLSVPGFKASTIFEKFAISLHSMPIKEREMYVSKMNSIFEFDIKNAAGKVRTWTLNLKQAPGSIFLGKGKTQADAIFSLSDEDFFDLGEGKLGGQKAFLTGKLKIKGNIMLATKLEDMIKLLRTAKPKL